MFTQKMNTLNFQSYYDIKLPTEICIVHIDNCSYSYAIVAFYQLFRSNVLRGIFQSNIIMKNYTTATVI